MNTNGHEYISFIAPQALKFFKPEDPKIRSFFTMATFGSSDLRVKNACGAFIRVYSCSFVGNLLLAGGKHA
jgi:hypothetical protein